jgi:BirA family biotin operon repressor/biotin-[acetyl-CoA-carboxylase] ligase
MTLARDWIIHRYDSLPSTMDSAALLARYGARERTAVVSGEQTAGRGRQGRWWHSAPHSGLYCTLILRPSVAAKRLGALSLVAANAVAEAIEAITGAHTQVKWPNDIWLGNDPTRRKAAGILLASSLSNDAIEYVLVGIGVNVSAPVCDLPPGATSVLAATGVRTSPDRVLDAVLAGIDRGYAAYMGAQGRPSLAAWRARAALLGEQVTIDEAGKVRGGRYAGIDDDGALLLLESTGQMHRVVSGDLVRGPRLDQDS